MQAKRLLAAGAAVLAVAFAGPAGAQTPVGTSFTYQGRLTDAGSPATGNYDFRFTLFDAAVGGAAVGTPVTANGIVVAQGLFASVLDFGPAAFAGQGRWVQVEVKPAGGGSYTALSPRQELTPAPYALFSSRTDPANLTVLNASNLTSGTVPGARLAGTYALALNLSNAGNTISGTFTGGGAGLTGLNASNLATGTVPSSVFAGLYSNAVNLSNTGNVFVGDGAGLTNLNAQAKLVRTVIVRPLGTPVQNGTALLAALAGITTAAGGNPWLLKLEPGNYDLGVTSLVMKPFVDIEGSGENVTKVTGVGQATNVVGTIQAVSNTELRQLTVENRGGDAYAKALFVDAAAPRITHVTVVAFGGTVESQGFFAQNGATPTVHHLTASATAAGTAKSFGVINLTAGPVYFDLNAFANGGDFAIGVGTYNGATPTIRSAVAIASGATTENQGFATGGASPTLENIVGIATGPATNNLGCLNFSNPTNVVMRTATCRGIGASGINYGVLTNGGANVTMYDVVADGIGGAFARGIECNGAGGGTAITNARASAVNGATDVAGLNIIDVSPRTVNVEAYGSGQGNAYVKGVGLGNSSPLLSHVTATAAAQTGTAVGVGTYSGSSPTLEHVSATANGGSYAYGVLANSGAGARPVLRGVSATAIEGAQFSIAVYDVGGGNAVLTDVVATASATNNVVVGVYNDDVNTTLTNVTVTTSGGGSRYGLVNGITTPVTATVDRSTLAGTTASILVQAGSTTRVAGSKLVGPVNNIASTLSCLFSYNGNYAALNATCQ